MSVKVCIINIGNELLLGRTININLSWLGVHLAELGLPISRSVTIQDNPEDIKATLQAEWQLHDVVIVTGGLGPTDDDITKAVIADFFHKQLEFREEVWKNVHDIFARRNIKIPEINRSQAMVPEGFTALSNSKGTAPGLYYMEHGKSFFALPGVPLEMKTIFADHISAILSKDYPCEPLEIVNIHTWNISESALAEKLIDLKIPDGVQLAWLPQTGRVDLRIYGKDWKLIDKLEEEIHQKAQPWIWGMGDDKPQTSVQGMMIGKGLTLSVAESCTGGLVQELLTGVPNSSEYFVGGIVTYSNEMKINQLDVKPDTLDKFGAVSIETAAEMAVGIKAVTKSDLGISITGIAGPGGGTIDKPIGLVCFGIYDGTRVSTKMIVFNGDRKSIRWKAAEYVLLLLLDYLGSRG